jgi:hypothetical protein
MCDASLASVAELAALEQSHLEVHGLSADGCSGAQLHEAMVEREPRMWCLFMNHDNEKLIFRQGRRRDEHLILMLKVALNEDRERELEHEARLLHSVCAEASPRDHIRKRVPWTGQIFDLRVGNESRKGLLQQRIPGELVNAQSAWFATALLREMAPDAAATSARDLLRWEAFFTRARWVASDLQWLRDVDGALWLFDPGIIRRAEGPAPRSRHAYCNRSSSSSRDKHPAKIYRNHRFHPATSLRRPQQPPRDSAMWCQEEFHEAMDAYVLQRQRAVLLTDAIVASLVAANATDVLQSAFCRHAVCELGCSLVALPPPARHALRRLGALGADVLAALGDYPDGSAALQLEARSYDGGALPSHACSSTGTSDVRNIIEGNHGEHGSSPGGPGASFATTPGSPCGNFEHGTDCHTFGFAEFAFEAWADCYFVTPGAASKDQLASCAAKRQRCQSTPACAQRWHGKWSRARATNYTSRRRPSSRGPLHWVTLEGAYAPALMMSPPFDCYASQAARERDERTACAEPR